MLSVLYNMYIMYFKECAMRHVSSAEARQHFTDHVSRAQLTGERIVITRKGKPVAAIVSLEDLEILQELEDRIDIAAADEAVHESDSAGWHSWEDIVDESKV